MRNDPKTNDHHIIPSSRGGEDDKKNIKHTPFNYHTAYHILFENMTPGEIYDYLGDVWFTPGKQFVKPREWLSQQD